MQPADHIAAALVAPWTAWWVEADDEASLLNLLERLGPFPQADLLEPWDDEPWRARVLQPPLEAAAELLRYGTLVPSEAPGFLEWSDRGRILEEHLSVGRIEATLCSDEEQGGLLNPDFDEHGTDVLQAAFLEATASSDAKALRITHPTTGRHGVHFHVGVSDDDPASERQAVLEAIEHVIASADPGLSHRVRWWFELKRVHVVAWRILPAQRTLPNDTFQIESADLSADDAERELQVVLPADQHDTHTLELAQQLGERGWIGSRPRWVENTFVACWTHPEAVRTPALPLPHRVVTGCPKGLEGDWLGVDPEWWSGGGRQFIRLHCSLRDRDLLPAINPRDGDAIDTAVGTRLASLAQIDPVHAGFPAIRLRLPALDTGSWNAIVHALGMLPEPAIGPVVYVRMSSSTFTLLLRRVDLDGDIPVWSAL